MVVPASRVGDAEEILGDVESTARPILPRVLAILVLIAFLAPSLVAAISWLRR